MSKTKISASIDTDLLGKTDEKWQEEKKKNFPQYKNRTEMIEFSLKKVIFEK